MKQDRSQYVTSAILRLFMLGLMIFALGFVIAGEEKSVTIGFLAGSMVMWGVLEVNAGCAQFFSPTDGGTQPVDTLAESKESTTSEEPPASEPSSDTETPSTPQAEA